jgi:hypothetical protein
VSDTRVAKDDFLENKGRGAAAEPATEYLSPPLQSYRAHQQRISTYRVNGIKQAFKPKPVMAQLRRLRELFDAQERVFTTVPGLADYVTQLGPSRGSSCAIRMCFLRGSHFTTGKPPH